MTIGFPQSRLAVVYRVLFSATLLGITLTATTITTGSVMTPPDAHKKMSLSSTAFKDGQSIPADYTCDGKNISPQLKWSGVPPETQSLVLIVDDPDAPAGVWTHWVLFNLSTDTSELAENYVKSSSASTAKQGMNDFKNPGYGGPCPPAGKAHRYFFRIYALDSTLNLPAGASRKTIDAEMAKHILAIGQLMGTYQRK